MPDRRYCAPLHRTRRRRPCHRAARSRRPLDEHTGTELVDQAGLQRIFGGWALDLGTTAFPRPTLIVAGRCDATVGYADATELLERYPRATLAVVEDAGHALPHERPDLLAALLANWRDRALGDQ